MDVLQFLQQLKDAGAKQPFVQISMNGPAYGVSIYVKINNHGKASPPVNYIDLTANVGYDDVSETLEGFLTVLQEEMLPD